MSIDQRNILVLGAGPFQVSGIKKLRNKGYYVVALDGNPDAVGKGIANEFIACNILSFEEVEAFLKSKGVDFFEACLSFSTDAPMRVMGKLNSRYCLKGLSEQQTLISSDKSAQRKFMRQCGLPTPNFQILNTPNDALEISYPCVVKPVDSAGSRGVTVVWRQEQYQEAVEKAFEFTRTATCLVEEFIQGTEYTVEALIQDGQVYIIGISEKFKPLGNYTVANQLHYNSPRVLKNREKIISSVERFFKAANYNNTITHTELILNERDNEFYLVESSMRSGGYAIFDEVLPYLADDDVVGKTIDVYLGKKVKFKPDKNRGAIMNFLSANPGKLKSCSVNSTYFEGITNAIQKHGFFLKEGDMVKTLDSDGARVAYILTFAEDWYKAFYLSNLVAYSINIEVETA